MPSQKKKKKKIGRGPFYPLIVRVFVLVSYQILSYLTKLMWTRLLFFFLSRKWKENFEVTIKEEIAAPGDRARAESNSTHKKGNQMCTVSLGHTNLIVFGLALSYYVLFYERKNETMLSGITIYSVIGVKNMCSKHRIQYFDWLISESEYDNHALNFHDYEGRALGHNIVLNTREYKMSPRNNQSSILIDWFLSVSTITVLEQVMKAYDIAKSLFDIAKEIIEYSEQDSVRDDVFIMALLNEKNSTPWWAWLIVLTWDTI